ncbi:TPA: ANR family transcriptional regulator [Serratia marcescens]
MGGAGVAESSMLRGEGNGEFPTTRLRHKVVARRAAALERSGEYGDAAVQWRRAGDLAVTATNRDWCEARQAACLRALARIQERRG